MTVTANNTSRKGKNKQNDAQAKTPTINKNDALTADIFKGEYRTSTALNVREQARQDAEVVGVLETGTAVLCDGVYALDNGIRYLHVTTGTMEGYCQVRFLIKQ